MIVSLPTPLGPEMITSMRAVRAVAASSAAAGASTTSATRVTGPAVGRSAVEDRFELAAAAAPRPG